MADIQNCLSVNIACEVKDIPETCTGDRAAFYVLTTDNTARPVYVNKYIIDCISGGKNVKYDILGNQYTMVNNFNRNRSFNDPLQITEWEGEPHP